MFLSQELMAQGTKLLTLAVSFNNSLYRQLHCMRKCNQISRKFRKPISRHMEINSSMFHTNSVHFYENDLKPTDKELAPRERFFQQVETKDKKTFLKLMEVYDTLDKVKRGHVEFIYAALKYMEDFGVDGDLEVYNKLMDVFPKGKMIPKNLIQAEFFHFPRHQECAIYTLDTMEYKGVCPNKETGEIILHSFGKSSHVYKKFARMRYWMPKLKNINPYQLPDTLPLDARELARLALKKMSVDTRTKIEDYDAEQLDDSLDKTWIVSAQSPVQQKLIRAHSEAKALYVEGPLLVWLKRLSMTYFVLRCDPIAYPDIEKDDDDVSNLLLHMFGDPKPKELIHSPSSVHEQEDGIFMAMCCTGTSSKDSLLSWIRFLRRSNPKLDSIPVLFKIRTSPTTIVAVNASREPVTEPSRDSEESKL